MVKKGKTVKINNTGHPIPRQAQRILTGLPVGSDLLVRRSDGYRYLVVYKREIGAAEALQLASRVDSGQPMLAVTESSTAPARQILADHGISVVDSLGNARIDLPDLHVWRDVASRKEPRRRTRLNGKAGLVAQAFLLTESSRWNLKQLAHAAGVSTSLAFRVVHRLEGLNLVKAEGRGPQRLRSVMNRPGLLQLIAEEDQIEPSQRIRAFKLARTPDELVRSSADGLARSQIQYALTGTAAGHLVAPFMSAIPVAEFWLPAESDPKSVVAAIDAQLVEDGHNLVFQRAKSDDALAFRREKSDVWIVNPVRLYVDLRRDPRRGVEQAEHVRQVEFGF